MTGSDSYRLGERARVARWIVLGAFLWHIRARERAGRDPLFSISLFGNRSSNLGLVTQSIQWLVLQGSFFVISVYLQQIRGYSAIETGLMLLPATIGILLSSAAAERFSRRHTQRRLIRAGFAVPDGVCVTIRRDAAGHADTRATARRAEPGAAARHL